MLKCIIIEDQPPAQKILQSYIGKTDSLLLQATFSDVMEAKDFLKSHIVDLIFTDISLPQVSGIDFLKSVKNLPPTILTTAYSDYALESYQYNVIDYLLKPFSFERFTQAIDKVLQLTSYQESSSKDANSVFFIKSGYDQLKVESKNILYIKSDADYTEIFTRNKKHISSYSLKDWLLKLDDHFCQVHKSYIINLDHLKKVSQNKAYLDDACIIPVGRTYKKGFMEKYLT